MARLAPPSEYEEDAERIDEDYVPSDATSDDEIEQALSDAGFPQASQQHIQDWLVSSEDVWPEIDSSVQDAGSVRRVIDNESGGTVSSARADQIADEIGGEISQARGRAASRVTSEGRVRTEDGRFIGSIGTVSEEVRNDGIYYVNQNTGTEGRAAQFNK